jgi:putative membrane-bound dehydrogenase-like protein
MILRSVTLALILGTTAGADPLLSPQEALKKFTAPEGFSVDLIAAEPDILQPIAFCWDARGRIWVVEGMTYPTRRGKPVPGDSGKPSEAQLKDIHGGGDRILIFGDEDGDGKFESRKVFAENLNLVSGIEMGYGGVYIGAAPYLMHIPDKDGDDKPDGPPEILLDGWGYQDTHETLNSFIWGPDGWLYGCHGVFTHSNVGAPGTAKEKRVPINCHYWRFHPVRKSFEAYASGTSNSWGFDYNEYGDWFSEACVIPHFWHIIQGGYYLRQSNPLGHFNPYVYTNIETIADHLHYVGNTPHSGNNVSDAAGGGHAHCGLCIYNGDNFPPEYRGQAMMFNIHGQRINQEQLVPEGSGYVAKHLPDFVKANDKNFTGVALKVGPDGAVYFIDWYDREKCHRPQPEVWDRSNGRIYRVKYDKTWKPWKGDVTQPGTKGQGGWYERQVQKLCYEAAKEERKKVSTEFKTPFFCGTGFEEVVAGVKKKTNEPGTGPVKELWRITAGLPSALDRELAGLFLMGENPDARKAAVLYFVNCEAETHAFKHEVEASFEQHVRKATTNEEKLNLRKEADAVIASYVSDSPFDSAKQLEMAKNDSSPRVRLAIASALQRIPVEDRWPIAEALIQHAEDEKDHNLPQMYWYAIEPMVAANPERALELAAKSKIPLVAQHIARRLAEAEGGVPHLVIALGKEKTAAGTVYLLKAALQGLKGRSGEAAPKGWDGAWANIDDVLARRPDAKPLAAEITDLREALAVSFGDKRAFPRLREQVKDTKLPVERRQMALQTLLDGKDPEIPSIIMVLLDDPAMRLAALNSLPRATGK